MLRSFASLLALFALTLSLASAADSQNPGKGPRENPGKTPEEKPGKGPAEKPGKGPDKKDAPSIHGTWVGYMNTAAGKMKLTSTLRADGTYKTISELLDIITVERGTFKFDDDVLDVEPEGGFMRTYTVTWEDKDTIKVKGGGLTITYKRQ